MTTFVLSGALIAAGALAAPVLARTPSSAGDQSSTELRVLGRDGSPAEALDIQGLYPSAVEEHAFFIEVGQELDGQAIGVVIANLRDYENECLQPELDAGDTRCGDGPDQGDLSSQLLVQWIPGTTDRSEGTLVCTAADEGTTPLKLLELSDQPQMLGAADVEVPLCAMLRLELPSRSDSNLVMTDSSVFDLEFGLIEGPVARSGEVDGSAMGTLPGSVPTTPLAPSVTASTDFAELVTVASGVGVGGTTDPAVPRGELVFAVLLLVAAAVLAGRALPTPWSAGLGPGLRSW